MGQGRFKIDTEFQSVRASEQYIPKKGKKKYNKDLVHQHRCKGCKRRYFCDSIECWETDFEDPCKYCGEYHIIDEAVDRKDFRV